MSRVLPILFNTDMVWAILDGRKTVTRRLVKHDVDAILNSPYHKEHPEVEDKQIISKLCMPPYQPGDTLYVRETWCDDRQFTHDDTPGQYFYRADSMYPRNGDSVFMNAKWRPSIHMPKEAARIWLKVKDVRVERLQECGKGWCLDIEKEGAVTPQDPILYSSDDAYHKALREEFQKLWNSTIKKSDIERYGWDANPWVWVIEFERIEVN